MLLDEEWNRGDTGLRARSEPGCRAGRSGRGIRRDGGHPSGSAPAGGDPARGAGQEYTANDYHAVSDEVKPDWDLSGAVEDLTARGESRRSGHFGIDMTALLFYTGGHGDGDDT